MSAVTISGNGAADAAWSFFLDFDPVEIEEMRLAQKLQLARYARQDLFSWEHREVTELQRYHRALIDLISREKATVKVED